MEVDGGPIVVPVPVAVRHELDHLNYETWNKMLAILEAKMAIRRPIITSEYQFLGGRQMVPEGIQLVRESLRMGSR